MPVPPDFAKLLAAVETYQTRLAQLQTEASPGPAAEQLQVLTDQFSQNFQKFQANHQQEATRLHEQIAGIQARLGALKQQAAEAVAAAQIKAAQPNPPPAKPPVEALDPELGSRLRRQLLEEFGNRPSPTARPAAATQDLADWVFGQ